MRRLLPALVAALVIACSASTETPPTASPDVEPTPAPTLVATGTATGSAPTGAPDGAACDQGDDCESGVCEGEGCESGTGTCMPRTRRCTRDLRAYCGCDGETFRASGSCPGRRYAQRGPCE